MVASPASTTRSVHASEYANFAPQPVEPEGAANEREIGGESSRARCARRERARSNRTDDPASSTALAYR